MKFNRPFDMQLFAKRSLAQIRAALAAIPEAGAELLEAFEEEMTTLRNEAATHRAAKTKVLDALGVKDTENVDQVVGEVKNVMATLKGAGNDPSQILRQMSELSNQVKTLTEQSAAEKAGREQEKAKRLEVARTNAAIEALTVGKAAKPSEIAKLIAPNLVVKDDDKIFFKQGDKEVPVNDGVTAWLKENPWAVGNVQNPGAGGGGGGGGGAAVKYTRAQIEAMDTKTVNDNWADVSASMAALDAAGQ